MQPPYLPSTCSHRGFTVGRHHGSVKYSRLPATSVKEKLFGNKSLVHQTQSSPLNLFPVRTYYGSNSGACNGIVGGGTVGTEVASSGVGTPTSCSTTIMDEHRRKSKTSTCSNSSRHLMQQNSLEPRLLSPPPPKKSPLNNNVVVGGEARLGDRQKHKLMALAPPSLHISFDAAEPEHCNEHCSLMPVSYSSDNFHGHRHSIATPRPRSPSPLKRDLQRQRQRLIEQSDLAGISSEFMRINGVIQSFKGIMADPQKATTSFYNRTASQSIDTVIGGNGAPGAPAEFATNKHISDIVAAAISPSRHQSTETYRKTPSLTLTGANNIGGGLSDSQTMQNINLKMQVSYRLRRRNELFDLRKKMADYSLFVAALGIFLMILENELNADSIHTDNKPWPYSNGLKSFIVFFTLLLLGLIISYHAIEIKLFMSDNSCEDWRIAVSRRRVITLSMEMLVCSICPIPGNFYFTWRTVHSNGSTVTTTEVPVEILLSIPMFLRCYLICRVMLLHSKLLTDASSRSIGALNRINFTARFVLKTLMTLSPGTVLLVFTASFWIIMAWIMRLCERWHDGGPEPNVEASKFQNYLNSLWLIAITSLTIGYGDMTPNTYCGRAVSVICGIMGAGTSSLVVAVVARKLELSRAEKHVHNFMMDSELSKRLKNTAANVLRETWFIYKNRRLTDKVDPAKIRFHQRKFLVAIYAMRKVKRDQRKLAENSVTVADMAKTTTTMYELVSNMHLWQDSVDEKISSLQSHCVNLEREVIQINYSIQKLPDLISLKLVQEIAEQTAHNNFRAPSLTSLSA